jgi:hypothetical protein
MKRISSILCGQDTEMALLPSDFKCHGLFSFFGSSATHLMVLPLNIWFVLYKPLPLTFAGSIHARCPFTTDALKKSFAQAKSSMVASPFRIVCPHKMEEIQ